MPLLFAYGIKRFSHDEAQFMPYVNKKDIDLPKSAVNTPRSQISIKLAQNLQKCSETV